MRVSRALQKLCYALLFPCVLLNIYVYFYPLLKQCHFANPSHLQTNHDRSTPVQTQAPFRLLAYGDPQIEGDTSLPDPNAALFPSLHEFRDHVIGSTVMELPGFLAVAFIRMIAFDSMAILQGYRKRLDLYGNDLYLAHLHRSMRRWTKPTHVVVLGDLLGSQWVSDTEFERRADRFWKRIFVDMEKVPDNLTSTGLHLGVGNARSEEWAGYLINIAGNHDIGYAGDIDTPRIERFERTFGKVNYNLSFALPATDGIEPGPTLRLVMLNSMNLDSPAYNKQLQNASLDFLASQTHYTADTLRSQDATVLLTHIPLYKPDGMCVDDALFDYFSANQGAGIMEQNHLTNTTSLNILDGLFVTNREDAQGLSRGIILNGHDHEGCSVQHHRPTDNASSTHLTIGGWHTKSYQYNDTASNVPEAIREITLRSMMGEFGGNAGLLSAWFDETDAQWRFEYSDCAFGVQHIWWTAHVLTLLVGLVASSAFVAARLESRYRPASTK